MADLDEEDKDAAKSNPVADKPIKGMGRSKGRTLSGIC